MNMKSEFVTRMQAQLKQWDTAVAALTEDAKQASAQAHSNFEEGLRSLKSNRDGAQKTFQQICTATESAAAQMHAKMEGAWTAMQEGLEKVSAELKK